MIQHDSCLPSRSQDPMNLAHCAGRVRCVMQHAIGVCDVKAFISERQPFAISDRELAVLRIERKMMPGNLDRSWSKINAGNFCAAASKLQKIRPHAAPDLEQSPAGEIMKAHYFRHPWRIFLITMSFYFVKELARAKLMLAAVDSAGGILTPLFTRFFFFIQVVDGDDS